MSAHLSEPVSIESEKEYGAPHCVARGDARGSLFQPHAYSLWRVVGQLGAGAQLEWDTEHGDEGLFVLQGAVEIAGRRAETGSAVIIEAGVPAVLHSLQDAHVVHCGPVEIGAPTQGVLGPAEPGRHVHVVTDEVVNRVSHSGRLGGETFFSDGSCPTCRIAFFTVDNPDPDGYISSSHTHSEDEIIHVLDGELQVGPLRVPSGVSIAVPKRMRYSFRTSGPYRFLNYRRDVSLYIAAPNSKPVIETTPHLRGMARASD